MKRRTRPDTVLEKRESDQTTKLLVRVVLFSARSLPRAPTLNPREADKVKNAPRRGSSSPSCPASASTRAMIQHGPCPLARTNWPGHVPAAPARADGRKAWRAEVPAGEDEKEEGREAVAAVRDQLRLQSDSPVWGTSCGAHRQARGAVAGGFGQRNCHEHRAGHDPAHSARHGERYAAMMRCRVMGSRVW